MSSSDGKILRRKIKLDGTPENVPLYPFEINTRLSELSLLDFSAQIINRATVEDLDSNERKRLRGIIKMRKGDASLAELSDEELDKSLCLVKEENGRLCPTVTGIPSGKWNMDYFASRFLSFRCRQSEKDWLMRFVIEIIQSYRW